MSDGDCSEATHIVLVGLMGAGKSSVGRALAGRLGRPLLDSDDMIVERTGRSVREIWIDDGEDAFRRLESEALADAVAADEPSVIAGAGGVVLSETNRRLLADPRVHVVWLVADVEVLVERVRNGRHRPLLDDDAEATLRQMHADREPLYQQVADAIVTVSGRSVADVANAVLRSC